MSQRTPQHWISGTAQTVGLSTVVVVAFDLSSTGASPTGVAWNDCSVYVEATFLGSHNATRVGGTRKVARGFQRVGGTLAAIDGAIIPIVAGLLGTGLLGSTFDLIATGNVIQATVTGIALNTLDWFSHMKIAIYQP